MAECPGDSTFRNKGDACVALKSVSKKYILGVAQLQASCPCCPASPYHSGYSCFGRLGHAAFARTLATETLIRHTLRILANQNFFGVNGIQVFSHGLDLAVLHFNHEVILVVVDFAVGHLGIRCGFD